MNTELDLLCWCWKYQLLGRTLRTTDGKTIEVSDPGLYNRNRYGVFFNAKVKIDGLLCVGNIQVLDYACHWRYHGKDINSEYQNVILVVVYNADEEVFLQNGKRIPIVQAEVPEKYRQNAWTLLEPTGQVSCKGHVMEYTTHLARHAWLAAMQTEWMEEVTDRMQRYHTKELMPIIDIAFNQILRGFGFTVNEVAMDLLARAIPINAIQNHIDDLFQIEAIIFGQAGLLIREGTVQDALPERFREKALMEGYFTKLRNEWLYLSHKYSMPMPVSRLVWYAMGKGSAYYPHVYLSMLVNWLYVNFHPNIVERVLEIETAQEAFAFFNSHCTPYWETHNYFGLESKKCMKSLTHDRISFLTMAVIPPLMFFIGRLRSKEELCDRAFDIMEQVKAFKTPESKGFADYGFCPNDAGEVMAMVWMQHRYCNERNCLKCRFAFEYIKKH